MLDLGLLLLRVVVGVLFAGHGLQKLTTRLGGQGLDGHAQFLSSLGFRPARRWAAAHGATELLAGLLLALGLAMPLAVAAVVGVMLAAAVLAHAPNGLWVQDGGFEYPLVVATSATALAMAGPGVHALDTYLGWQAEGSWGLAAVAVGLLAGAVASLLARRGGRATAGATG